jgi:hypothetical protein
VTAGVVNGCRFNAARLNGIKPLLALPDASRHRRCPSTVRNLPDTNVTPPRRRSIQDSLQVRAGRRGGIRLGEPPLGSYGKYTTH